MSLIATAAPWNAGETTNKRVSTLRKTIKKTAGLSDTLPDYNKNTNGLQGSNYQSDTSNTILKKEDSSSLEEKENNPAGFGIYPPDNQRSNKVLELISNLSPDNAGSNLVNFNPPEYPKSTGLGKPVQPAAAANQMLSADAPIAPLPNEFQIAHPNIQFQREKEKAKSNGTQFYPNQLGSSSATDFSNYRYAYEQSPSLNQGHRRYIDAVSNTRGVGNGMDTNTKLMDKINYMIHMLEQQQHERTDNVMEEFILYSLLGVFIIFVVDAFARSGNGKYVR